ncbi:Uncharacterised protein [Vibrio cholerae]|nr:Uncharacterised protein [Vibrio cholerae]
MDQFSMQIWGVSGSLLGAIQQLSLALAISVDFSIKF